MNNINSFTFYRDFYNLIDTAPIKDKKDVAIAILDYVFKDEIDDSFLSPHGKAIFHTLQMQLDKSKCQSKRRTKKETEQEPKEEPKTEPKGNKTSILSFKFYISNFKFIDNNDLLISKIEDWLNYKQQRKDKKYTDIGFNTLLKRIDKAVEKYGTNQVVELIDDCMANNYQGIIFDKLLKPNQQSSSQDKWEQTKESLRGIINDRG